MGRNYLIRVKPKRKWSLNKLVTLLTITVVSFVSWQLAHADKPDIVFSEVQVKDSVEDIALVYICSDQTLLDNIGFDSRRCVVAVALFTDACWKILDKVVSNYEVVGDEHGPERLEEITDVYIPCVQAEFLLSALRQRKKSQPE